MYTVNMNTNTKIGHTHLIHLNPTLWDVQDADPSTLVSHVVQYCAQVRHFNVACVWERLPLIKQNESNGSDLPIRSDSNNMFHHQRHAELFLHGPGHKSNKEKTIHINT